MKLNHEACGAAPVSDEARDGEQRTFVIRERISDEDIVFLMVTQTEDDQRPEPVPEAFVAAAREPRAALLVA